jgi:hypothetical protein
VVVCFAGIGCLLPPNGASPGLWVNRLLAGMPVIDLALFCTSRPLPGPVLTALWALTFIGCVVLSLLFQRWFRAT